MNILIFSWRGLGHPHSRGAESVTHHHAKAWVEAGHSVTLFTSSYKGANKNEIVDGVKIIRMGSQYLTVHMLAFFWYFFQDQKFDLVVDHFRCLFVFVPIVLRVDSIRF